MYWKEPLYPMKNILQLFTLGLFIVTLSSCVDAGGYVNTGPGYSRRPPARPYHPSYHNNNGYYGNNHYHSRPAPRPSGVNARVGTRGLPLNVNSNTRLGIF
jgi:hypothetical protein